jgi:hypothetical protein
MGQYFKIVNKTKKQVLEPMTFGSGCKNLEIIANATGGSVLQALGHLITTCERQVFSAEWLQKTGRKSWKGTWSGDEIIMVGDYHESELYDKCQNTRWYEDISEEVMYELFFNDGGEVSWIGQQIQDWVRKYGTDTLYGRRKELILEWFPVACHEGNLRQKYDFVEKEQEFS